MKRLTLLLVLPLGMFACTKGDSYKTSEDTYFCEDYKNKEISILGTHTEEIDALWADVYIDKDNRMTFDMFSERTNGLTVSESGTITLDGLNMTLTFKDGKVLEGIFTEDRLRFDVDYIDGQRSETIRFDWKDSGKKGDKGDKWKWN